MSAAEFKRARAVSAAMRERIEKANRTPPPPTVPSTATIVPFPIDRQRRFVERELRVARDYDDASAFRWLSGVARRHGRRLEKLGVAANLVDADVKALVDAFGIGDTAPRFVEPSPLHDRLWARRSDDRPPLCMIEQTESL